MDKLTKFLRRLSPKERDHLAIVIKDIAEGNLKGYDRKKMKGCGNLFRIRIGDIRIVYTDTDGERRLLLIDRRDENTFCDF